MRRAISSPGTEGGETIKHIATISCIVQASCSRIPCSILQKIKLITPSFKVKITGRIQISDDPVSIRTHDSIDTPASVTLYIESDNCSGSNGSSCSEELNGSLSISPLTKIALLPTVVSNLNPGKSPDILETNETDLIAFQSKSAQIGISCHSNHCNITWCQDSRLSLKPNGTKQKEA